MRVIRRSPISNSRRGRSRPSRPWVVGATSQSSTTRPMRFVLSPTGCSSIGSPKLRGFELMTDILLTHAYFLKYDVIERRVMKPYPPLGILYLSAYLKRAGFTVDVFDATFRDPADFEETVRRVRPKIIGIYANIITRDNVLRMAKIAKDNGVRFVVCGGPDAPEWADLYLQNGIDIIGTNEGERTLEQLIPWLHERGMSGLEDIPGIIFLKNGCVYRTAPRPPITDLDSLPWPDRSVLVMEDYFKAWKSRHGESSVSLIT